MIKCLFLVEGPFDRQRLSVLNTLFDSAKIEIIPLNCDVLVDKNWNSNYKETVEKILAKEKTFSIHDFDYIIQICDLDGCFIDDKYIIKNDSINKIQYYEDHIEVLDKGSIINRNHIKAENINELLMSDNITLYYNSTNIDHAFDGIQNPSKRQKRDLAIDMYNKYKDNGIELITKIYYSNKTGSKDYISSWNLIKEGFNSLSSSTNLIFFIIKFKDYLKEDIKIVINNIDV